MPDFVLIALAVVAIAIVALVVFVATRPSEFRVVRSATMAAHPAAVFVQVNDLHNWESWSPWAKLDPTMKTTYEGAPSGVGAIYKWNGNKTVGEGCTTILESQPSERIRIKLQMFRPFAGINDVAFAFVPEKEQTLVTWTMTGTNNFIVKAVRLVMNMDKLIGGQFEQGLAQLKAVVEGPQSAARTA